MTKEIKPAWLKSKDEFGQEVNLSPITHDRDVLVSGKTNLEEEIEAIYHAIDDISLTPGPQGNLGTVTFLFYKIAIKISNNCCPHHHLQRNSKFLGNKATVL